MRAARASRGKFCAMNGFVAPASLLARAFTCVVFKHTARGSDANPLCNHLELSKEALRRSASRLLPRSLVDVKGILGLR